MVKLTDVIIKGKTRCDKLEDVKNLNLWGQDITDVSILHRTPSMEVLSLSVNGITSLKHFMHCTALRELYLRKNMVADLTDIRFLMPLPHLKVLWLSDNPCADVSEYRSFVIAQLPSLEKFDNLDITQDERKLAQNIPHLQPATASELFAEEATPATAPSTSAASLTQSRPLSPLDISPLSPAGTSSTSAQAASRESQPCSTQRVPGSVAAVPDDTGRTCTAATGLSSVTAADSGVASLSNQAAVDRGGATAVAAGSFAFLTHQQDAHGKASCFSWEQPEQRPPHIQQQQAKVASINCSSCDRNQAGASPNVLYAVMALLADLDAPGLGIVQQEVQQRLRALQG